MNDSIVFKKAYNFSINVVGLYRTLTEKSREYVLSKQCLRSGTAIAALISEAKFAQSQADFVSKMSIALKEANETLYWLNLLHDTRYIEKRDFENLIVPNKEIVKMLVSIINTSKRNIPK